MEHDRPAPAAPASRRVHAWLRRLNLALAHVAAAMILVMAAATIWEVFTRYALRNPSTWTYPVSAFALFFMVYLAAGHTLERDAHVRVDLVVQFAGPRWRRRLEWVSAVVGALFVGVFTWEATRFWWQAVVQGRHGESTLRWPLGPILIAMPVGLLLLLLTYGALMADGFRYTAMLPGEAQIEEPTASDDPDAARR